MTKKGKLSWVFFCFINAIILSAVALAVNAESNAAAGFSGKVVSVDTASRSFQAEVRLVYAGATGSQGSALIAGILPPGKVVTVKVTSATKLTNVRGQPITLDQVQQGQFFNADVLVDTSTKVVTAKNVQFGTKIAPLAPPNEDKDDNPKNDTTPQDQGKANAVAGFSGKVVSVDLSGNSFQAEVRLVYAGARGSRGSAGIAGILPPGKIVTVNVPSNAKLTNARGQPITLDQVQQGQFFNADVLVDTSTKVVTAKNVQFGTKTGPLSPPPGDDGGNKTSNGHVLSGEANAVSGVSGKVVSVNEYGPNSFIANVKLAYAGRKKGFAFGVIFPPGKVVTINVPSDAVIKRFGTVISLDGVQPGDFFNGMVWVDTATRVITAKTIQVFSKDLSTVSFSGNISQLDLASDSKTMTVVNQNKQKTMNFVINNQTQVFRYKSREHTDTSALALGASVEVLYYTSSGNAIASKIVVGWPQVTMQQMETIGLRATNVLGKSFVRLDAIIANMEEQIATLKASNIDTTQAETDLEKAKNDLSEAKVLLNNTNELIDAIPQSSDPQKATEEAKHSLRETVKKTKDVLADLKKTNQELKRLKNL